MLSELASCRVLLSVRSEEIAANDAEEEVDDEEEEAQPSASASSYSRQHFPNPRLIRSTPDSPPPPLPLWIDDGGALSEAPPLFHRLPTQIKGSSPAQPFFQPSIDARPESATNPSRMRRPADGHPRAPQRGGPDSLPLQSKGVPHPSIRPTERAASRILGKERECISLGQLPGVSADTRLVRRQSWRSRRSADGIGGVYVSRLLLIFLCQSVRLKNLFYKHIYDDKTTTTTTTKNNNSRPRSDSRLINSIIKRNSSILASGVGLLSKSVARESEMPPSAIITPIITLGLILSY